jgi:hypothetical protein
MIMDRRNFLRASALAGSVLPFGLGNSSAASISDNPVPSAEASRDHYHVQYARENIPFFEIPPYRGKSYADRVPDTLDIAERAKLAVHVLTSMPDPGADYEPYFAVDFFRNPPVMRHMFADWVQICEAHMEDLPLLRVATGSGLNTHVDQVWMQTFLKSIGPDGLMYIPLNGRPWIREGLAEAGTEPLWTPNGTTITSKDPSVSQVTTGEMCGRALGLMTVYYLRDRNPMWLTMAQQMIERLSSLAVRKGDYAYLTGGWVPNAKLGPGATMPMDFWAEEWNGRAVEGLSQHYKASGYDPALRLAGMLARFLKNESKFFDPQGAWLIGDSFKKAWGKSFVKYGIDNLTVGGGSTNHTILLLGLLEYATAANDREMLEFVRASFDWAKNPDLPYGVSSLVGWFPEIYLPNYPTCEGCTVGIMVSLSIKLSEAGAGDYWDTADRWIRNHFAENQLTDLGWVRKVSSREPPKPVGLYATADHVPERNIGAFAGWATGNDWATQYGIMHCCTGNGSRALYYIWEHIVTHKDGQLRVNLLLNRASRWADLYSYIPYEGRVDLKFKAACEHVLVRAPEWIKSKSEDIVCRVNEAPRLVNWEGRYFNIGQAGPGDVASLTFPIPERTVKEKIGTATYTLVLRGNTVVSIDPPGSNGPLYQRSQYRSNQTQWRTVQRFVPEDAVRW